MNKNLLKKSLFTLIKIFAVIIPFYLIFKQVDIRKIGPAIHQIQWWAIPALLSTVILMMILQGVRWWLLIKAFTNKLTFLRSMAYHFSSAFYSLLIPNSLSQDIFRSVFASKQAGSVISWSSTWVAKISGIVVSFGFSMYGLILLSKRSVLPQNIILITAFFLIVLLFLTILSFSKKITRSLRKYVILFIPKRFLNWVESFREGIYQFRNKKSALFIVLICTILTQFIFVLGVTLLLLGITGKFYFFECMAFMPLIEMISMAQPFTPNGIGVREALVALMFKQLGLTSEQLSIYIIISNFSILVRLLGIIPILLGYSKKELEKAE